MKYLPFDISIYDDPLVRRLSPFQTGLFTFLILDYWRTGIPLPETDKELVELSNTSYQHWGNHKEKVMLAIHSVKKNLLRIEIIKRIFTKFRLLMEGELVRQELGVCRKTTFSPTIYNRR